MPDEINEKLLALGGKEPNPEDFEFPAAQAYIVDRPEIFNNVYINYERNQYLYQEAVSYILENPGIFVQNYLKKLLLFWNPISLSRANNSHNTSFNKWVGSLFYSFILVFFLIGVIKERKDFQKHLFLYLVLAVYVGAIALFTTTVRYRMPIDPFLMLFAAAALERCRKQSLIRFLKE